VTSPPAPLIAPLGPPAGCVNGNPGPLLTLTVLPPRRALILLCDLYRQPVCASSAVRRISLHARGAAPLSTLRLLSLVENSQLGPIPQLQLVSYDGEGVSHCPVTKNNCPHPDLLQHLLRILIDLCSEEASRWRGSTGLGSCTVVRAPMRHTASISFQPGT